MHACVPNDTDAEQAHDRGENAPSVCPTNTYVASATEDMSIDGAIAIRVSGAERRRCLSTGTGERARLFCQWVAERRRQTHTHSVYTLKLHTSSAHCLATQ